MILVRLVLALFITDFILQFNWIIRNKTRLVGLAVHGLIYSIVSWLLLIGVKDMSLLNSAALVFILGVTHPGVDFFKDRLVHNPDEL